MCYTKPGATRPVETDIGLKFLKNYVCRLYPRLSLSLKRVILGGGVIDSDFRRNICAILINLSQRIIEIETGDRIAQVLFFKRRGG